ncbi:hypothetical protein RIF29_19777 [Crotalaria pallida]|uniref:BRX domain-containing protein n=1 Tax=Crotalaria pallida TaxID=3830 RepID=A0AAN9I4F7_CROPI
MFTCTSYKKQTSNDKENVTDNGTPRKTTKSFTAQIKDMAGKVSSSLQFKPCICSSSHTFEGVQSPQMKDVSIQPTSPLKFSGLNYHGESFGTRVIVGSTRNQTRRRDEATTSSSRRELVGLQTPRHISSSTSKIAEEGQGGSREWMAEVEEGVYMTFMTLLEGGSELKRVRFSFVSVLVNLGIFSLDVSFSIVGASPSGAEYGTVVVDTTCDAVAINSGANASISLTSGDGIQNEELTQNDKGDPWTPDGWSRNVSGSNMYQISKKLYFMRHDFHKLNQMCYANIVQQENAVRQDLEEIQRRLSLYPSDIVLRQ